MNQKIWVHRYVLRSHFGLNSRSISLEHPGALIRVEVDGISGFGCLHPWEVFGDTPLEGLLQELKDGRASRHIRSALKCARHDRVAREKGLHLMNDLRVPRSHGTVVGTGDVGAASIREAVQRGFDTVKLKVGRNPNAEADFVKQLHTEFPELLWRFDANGMLTEGQFDRFLDGLGAEVRERIDFFEDPCGGGAGAWEECRKRYGVRTAVDRDTHSAEAEYDVSIIKPAVDLVARHCDDAQLAGRMVVFSGYMDHPVGQSYAAYRAGKADKEFLGLVDKTCGFMTHEHFESDAFTEALGKAGPEWKSAKGTGLGFDDLLDALDWERWV